MKKIIVLIFLVLPIAVFAQTVSAPSNIYFSIDEIKGNADPNTVIKVDRNIGAISGRPIITIVVNNNGYFAYTFESPLPLVGAANAQPVITIWAENGAGIPSGRNNYMALEAKEALQKVANKSLILPENKLASTAQNPLLNGSQPFSTTFKYKITMLNTNFTVPIARFNFVGDQSGFKRGDLLLFNSIGAGVGISGGEMEKTTDANGKTINTDFSNTLGVHLGLLFSSGKEGTEQKNIFAPTLSVSVLDFQLGIGYELGSTASLQKKGFLTLAYAIPLSKLIKGKYYVLSATRGFNDTNPQPLKDDGKGSKVVDNTQKAVNGFL